MRQIYLFFLVLTSTFLLNCPKTSKPDIKPAGVEGKEGINQSFQSLLGEVFVGTVAGVDLTGLPKKLLYPKARPLARYGKYERARWGCSYNLETSDEPEKVWQYYTNLLSQWKQAEEVHHERYTRRSYIGYDEGVDKETVDITISRQEGKTVIVLAHTYNQL